MAPRKKAKLLNNDEADAPHDDTVSKAPKNTRRSRRGCLESVQMLPLDVSLQIFGLLHPKDLLSLARTSKAFRSFFLNRANSLSIWKSSLRQVEGLPDKPQFLSEPAFAHLLFNPFCQKCGKSGIPNPVWAWFVRYCTACIETSSIHMRYGPYLDGPLSQVVEKDGMEIFDIYRAPGRRIAYRVHKREFDRFVEQWQNTQGDEDQRKALVEQARVTAGDRAVIAQRFEDWHATEKYQRSVELEDMREQRLQEIIVRLRADEWLPEVVYFGEGYIRRCLARIPIVRHPNLLTDRGWPKVRTALQGEMNGIRACRLQEERETLIEERWHELAGAIIDHYVHLPKTASMDCRPTPSILLGEKECFELVVAPRDREVTRRDFAEVLPEVCARWQASCAEELRGLVKDAMPPIPGDVDPLALAVAVFDCGTSSCSKKVAHRYPDLLAHICGRSYGPEYAKKEEDVDLHRAVAWLSSPRANGATRYDSSVQPRTKIRLRDWRPGDSVVRMRYIVAALGLDPTCATREDLDKSEARLWCRVCSSTVRTVYTWEEALWHAHVGCGVDRDFWERVHEEDMATVRELEAKKDVSHKEKVRWGCTLCQDRDGTALEMASHLKDEHHLEGFETCVEDGTVYRHLSQSHCSNFDGVALPKPLTISPNP